MKATALFVEHQAPDRPALLDRTLQHLLFSVLEHLEDGRVTFTDQTGSRSFGRLSPRFPHEVRVDVHDFSAYGHTFMRGSLGFAESYMAGAFEASDLVDLARLFVADRGLLQRLDGSFSKLSQPVYRAYHALRRNTRRGSRRNIAAHYDLGNDFYRLWLDETLSYSAAIFEREDQTLAEASHAKNERICRKLGLVPGDRLLEIGSGFGALALHAATHHGARVTTTTLSEEQYRFTCERVRRAGLTDQVTVLLRDYRELSGSYDKLVSVEMIEAIGYQYYDEFFRRCSRLLSPEGLALIQTITIEDQQYEAAKDSVDFIKRYIFPGSCIPSVTALLSHATRSSDLKLVHLEDLTPHYARTLRIWRQRFIERKADVYALGFSTEFARTWELYLAYCEAGFWERYNGDAQLLLARPGCRSVPFVPPLPDVSRRADLVSPWAAG